MTTLFHARFIHNGSGHGNGQVLCSRVAFPSGLKANPRVLITLNGASSILEPMKSSSGLNSTSMHIEAILSLVLRPSE